MAVNTLKFKESYQAVNKIGREKHQMLVDKLQEEKESKSD